jgi:hypothetical protein
LLETFRTATCNQTLAGVAGHTVWTYQQPGNGGHANPKGQEIHRGRFHDVWAAASKLGHDRQPENLYEHLRGLAAGLGALPIVELPVWLVEYRDTAGLDLNPTQLQGVFDTVVLGQELAAAGASWFVADLAYRNP